MSSIDRVGIFAKSSGLSGDSCLSINFCVVSTNWSNSSSLKLALYSANFLANSASFSSNKPGSGFKVIIAA